MITKHDVPDTDLSLSYTIECFNCSHEESYQTHSTDTTEARRAFHRSGWRLVETDEYLGVLCKLCIIEEEQEEERTGA